MSELLPPRNVRGFSGVGERLRSRAAPGWPTLVAAAAAAVLLLVLLWRARSIMALVTGNSDLSAPLVMGEEAHRYDGAQLVTGRFGWWGPLWAVQLLRPLPAGFFLATWLPIAGTVAVAGLVAWQARRLWGGLAAIVVVLVALAAGAPTWVYDASWSARSTSWWAMALTGLLAVAVVGGARPGRPRLLLAAAAVLVAVVTGAVASGDQLAVVGAIVPLFAAAALAAARRRIRLAGGLAAYGVVLLVATSVVARIAESAGYLRQDFPTQLVPFRQLGASFANLVLAVEQLWADASIVGTAAGYVGLALVAGAVVAGARELWRAVSAPGDDALVLQRGVWIAFWVSALVLYLAAFSATTASGPLGQPVVRYLHGVPLATAAVLAPLAALPRARAVPGAAVVVALLTSAALATGPPKPPPIDQDLSRSSVFGTIEQVARREGVTRGFASYWTAYPLVIHSGRALDVTPIGRCGDDLCPMYIHYIDQAYAPQPGIRSFVLVDQSPLALGGHGAAWATALPARMRPEKVVDVGGGIQMAIFDHDAARDLVPNGGVEDPRAGHGGPLEPVN